MNDHRRRERKAARRQRRIDTGRRPRKIRAHVRRAQVDDGSAFLLKWIGGLLDGSAVGRPPKRYTAIPCRCDPPVNHGQHFIESRVELPAELREAA